MSTLLIFGASRGVGLELARHARVNGRHVVAMVREGSDTSKLSETGTQIIRGDAFCVEDVARAFAQSGEEIDVISTLGGRTEDGRRADDEANINVIAAAVAGGITRRFVLVTSIGCGEMAPFRSERAIVAFGAAVDAKTKAETYLRKSNLIWTIVRPGGLVSEPATDKAFLSDDPEIHGFVHREDVALLALRILHDPATIGRVFAAVDLERVQCANPVFPFPLAIL